MLLEELSAVQPQSVHESSNVLVGSDNDLQNTSWHESLPSQGLTSSYSYCCHLLGRVKLLNT